MRKMSFRLASADKKASELRLDCILKVEISEVQS